VSVKAQLAEVFKGAAGQLGGTVVNGLLHVLEAIADDAFADADGDGIPNLLDRERPPERVLTPEEREAKLARKAAKAAARKKKGA